MAAATTAAAAAHIARETAVPSKQRAILCVCLFSSIICLRVGGGGGGGGAGQDSEEPEQSATSQLHMQQPGVQALTTRMDKCFLLTGSKRPPTVRQVRHSQEPNR